MSWGKINKKYKMHCEHNFISAVHVISECFEVCYISFSKWGEFNYYCLDMLKSQFKAAGIVWLELCMSLMLHL